MNAIGYIRISIKDQSRWSLSNQEKYITDYCKRYQVDLIEMFQDNGKKSFTFDRPDYIALEKFIKKHKGTVQYLIVLDHDRFSRNLPEALMKIDYLEKKHGIKVLSTSEPLDLDTSDPMVFMNRAFKYMMANQELFTIRRRAKMGIRHAQESGRFVHGAPFGYKNSTDAGGKPLLLIDESKAFIIQKIFRDYISGMPHYIIHQEAKKLGFTLLSSDAVARVLSNSTYAGLIRVSANEKEPEKIVKGVHQAIIREEQFWLVQDLIYRNKRIEKIQPREDFPLRGVLKCTCGVSMTAGFSKGKKSYYLYYRCIKHSNINVPGKLVHMRLEELLRDLSFTEEQVCHICNTSRLGLKDSLAIGEKQSKIKQNQLKELQVKMDRLEERLVNEEIELETYRKYHNKFRIEKALIQEEINHLNTSYEGKLEQQLTLLPHLTNLPSIYEKANLNQKHAFLKGVFKRGLAFSDGAFRTPWVNPMFQHNLFYINKKGLLFVEQSSEKNETISFGAPDEIRTHIDGTGNHNSIR